MEAIVTRKSTVVQIFVASPNDVLHERDQVENLVAEYNRNWSRIVGLRFEVLRGDTDVRPAIGRDPQAVVNAQIGEYYDVFIGILWGRFGTPTPRAASGTLEEFKRALLRFRTTNLPEIMVYFKDAPIPPSKIDTEQLRAVQEFRNSLTVQGAIYSVFEDDSGLEASLRSHLATLSHHFLGVDRPQPESPPSPYSKTEDDSAADELGYLDYIETYETSMAGLNSSLNSIVDATERMNIQIRQRALEVADLSKTELNPRTARQTVKRVADDMVAYARTLSLQIPLVTTNRELGLAALSKALILSQDFENEDRSSLERLQVSVKTLIESERGATASITGMRDAAAALPRMTGDLNRAKRGVMEQLDSFLGELRAIDQTLTNIVDSIERMLSTSTT